MNSLVEKLTERVKALVRLSPLNSNANWWPSLHHKPLTETFINTLQFKEDKDGATLTWCRAKTLEDTSSLSCRHAGEHVSELWVVSKHMSGHQWTGLVREFGHSHVHFPFFKLVTLLYVNM